MSDRMPEDLPVRKCIDVMVGIIRSEVIKFYDVFIRNRFPTPNVVLESDLLRGLPKSELWSMSKITKLLFTS